MKYLLEIILTVIIIFFLWNILKRLFFVSFYKFPASPGNKNQTTSKSKKKLDSKLNWDAETVEYEEINDKNK
ncbi:hypothetical protein [Kaistella pullorum]|uniref:AraC family transcriptional regulator n=1 Tax=Kaistella pullorum TaxID=2763074 RepID=A0ABR8WP77_9FLAO|nr:hypothetical protein [Kaistella pullorum]MBD8018521.1 hypothetical protein [Kaistella pullorum]